MNCKEKYNCTGCGILGVIFSIVVGVVFGVLFANSLIPAALNFIIIALIISGVSTLVTITTLLVGNILKGCYCVNKCIACGGKCFIAGTIGTLLAGTAALTAGITATSVASAIFVGLTALFFVLMIIAVVSLFICTIQENCNRKVCDKE